MRIAHRFRPPKFEVKGFGKFKGKDSLRMQGSDFWGVVTTSAAGTYLDLINLPAHPMAILNTRLQVESTLWTKYHFLSMEIEYIPSVGTSQNGDVMLTHLADPELPIPGGEGTLQYATALMTVDGTVVTPYYLEDRHRFRPRDKKKEYYIQPDLQDESRLTVQGILKVLQMTSDNPGAIGFLYVHYDILLYDKVISVNPSGNSSIPVSKAANATNIIHLQDGGWADGISFSTGAGTTLVAASTLYAVYFNFSLGYLRPMTIYYWRTAAVLTNTTYLYLNAFDANTQTSKNLVIGSWAQGAIPNNANMVFANGEGSLEPDLKMANELDDMRREISELRSAVEVTMRKSPYDRLDDRADTPQPRSTSNPMLSTRTGKG